MDAIKILNANEARQQSLMQHETAKFIFFGIDRAISRGEFSFTYSVSNSDNKEVLEFVISYLEKNGYMVSRTDCYTHLIKIYW